jgi:hypothetical protein
MTNMFTHVGNYSQYSEEMIAQYSFPKNNGQAKITYEWGEKRYQELPTVMMKICHDACVASGDEELLESNPFVIVERHHNILCKDGKVKNEFATHSDRDGPAGGPCRSLLYYYQIDEGIDDVGLHFYEWRDEDEIMTTTDKPLCTFTPISGDVITFGDNIPHCPGNFKTDSETPKVRGVFAIFIKHPTIETEKPRSCMSWLDCFS